MTEIGIRDISVSFRDNKISNISLVQGDALTRGFDITFVNAKGEVLPPDDDYVVELVAVNSKDKDTPYACRHEVVDDKYRVMIPPEALLESGSVTIQLVFYQKSTKAVIHTIKQKCPIYQSIGQEFVESNNLYVDITKLRLTLEEIETLKAECEELIIRGKTAFEDEDSRIDAENKRNLDEAIRKDNESIRKANEEKREQLKTALIELKNSIESDLESINLTVDDIISSEDDRKQNEIVREEIKVELENLVADIQNKLDNGDFVGEKGEQGIQGEQGPQGPPGEVRQEEFDNFKDAYSLKTAKLEKELQNYKSTMANINVNQEVKQSVSGYGSVSLPKNTANGQVSAIVKGETIENLLGDVGQFDTLAGWGVRGNSGDITLSSNRKIYGENSLRISVGQEGIKQYGYIYRDFNTSLGKEKRYLVSLWVYIEQSDDGALEITVRDKGTFDARHSRYFTLNNQQTMKGNWNRVFIKIDTNNNLETDDGFRVLVGYGSLSKGISYWDGLMVNEISEEDFNLSNNELLQKHPYINGTKSTISASRLKSVNENKTQESVMYLPNVGELRSLPNGVRDEIKVSGGKAELVKRVSDTMEELAEPIITPIKVSGTLLSNPSGTVYVEKVVADAGIYDSGINVLHQDLPIDYVEKLSKVDFTTGLETELDISKVVISEDRKSFTHPNLVDGDIIFFTYYHNLESTLGETTIEYYDSRHTLKDDVTGKFYKIAPKISDGVLTNELVEV